MKFLALFSFLLVLSGCSATKVGKQDLDFIYTTIVENHPGVYNNQDPEFNIILENSYQAAQRALPKASDDLRRKQIIQNFTKSFDDSHLWVNWYNEQGHNFQDNQNLQHFEVSSLNNQITWIALPTFDLQDEQKKKFDYIIDELPKFKDKAAIIFDLRTNRGGNSEYGSKIINALYGENYAKQKRYEALKKQFVDWRASKGNLLHLTDLFKIYRSPWLKTVEIGIAQAISRHEVYYREVSEEKPSFRDIVNNKVTAEIIVIIDSGNVSAALDFIDELKIMGAKLTLIGKKTKADRLYMEIRTLQLPSKIGDFSFPIKVFRNRFRKDNEAYFPDLEYDFTHTEKLQDFVIKNIKRKKLAR